MQNTGSTLGQYAGYVKNTAKGAFDVANTLKYLQNPNTTGGQRLAKIIGTVMSFGSSAAKDSVEQ